MNHECLFYIHPFWFLGDTMLRVNIGPMQPCVTKNQLLYLKMIKFTKDLLGTFGFAKKNEHEKRHQDFSHLKTKNRWPNFLIDFSRGRHQESCHLETERGVLLIFFTSTEIKPRTIVFRLITLHRNAPNG